MIQMTFEAETKYVGREKGPLGTSAWAKLVNKTTGEVVAFSVGDDEFDALESAAEFAGFLIIRDETDKPLEMHRDNQL